MKKFFLGLFFICSSLFSFAQGIFTVSGKVIDAATKAPLQAASVFAQNTTIGTVTDAAGNFSIKLYDGGYDLVVSFTGYQTYTRRISSTEESDKNITVELKVKDKALEEVAIKTSNEIKDGWIKYGDFFSENFIGKTANSKTCTIKNKEALKFYFSKKRNRLKVLAAEPLLIENPALGYNIKYTLDSFTYDYNTSLSTFAGYPLFEEMTSADASTLQAWKAARLKAYNGSILHFMRSVYNKQLKEQGFEIQFLVKVNGADSAIKLGNLYGAINYTKDDSTQVVEFSPNQPDMAVLYKNEKPDADYIAANEDVPKGFELSIVNITPSENINIEKNGFFFDQNDLTATGYWSWEKAGDMLPYDFRPD